MQSGSQPLRAYPDQREYFMSGVHQQAKHILDEKSGIFFISPSLYHHPQGDYHRRPPRHIHHLPMDD
jgi:hypothetical protein